MNLAGPGEPDRREADPALVRDRDASRDAESQGIQEVVVDEVRHLLEIEEKGESAATPVIAILLVSLVVGAVGSVMLTLTFAFYFGWL